MPNFFRVIPAVALMVLCFSAASSFASEWHVRKATQQVLFTLDKKTWVPVVVGTTIPNTAWISTGPRGRVLLERGVERVAFGPKTLAAIITKKGIFSRKTEVIQQKGEIALNIEKRSRPHTYVHTPFLAAVVKGTTFTVTVTANNASVSVDEGLVQVSSFTSGRSANVGPGQQVTVDQAQNMSVAGVAEAPSVFSVEPMQASVPAVGHQAPVGAALGLGSFSDQSSTSSTNNGTTAGVSSDSSGSGSNGRDDSGNGQGNGGGNGTGNNGKGQGNGGGNGTGNNGNGQGNGGGNGTGNNGNGQGNGGGNGTGNNGNGQGSGGGNGTGNNGNGQGSGGGTGNSGNGQGNGGGNGPGNNGNDGNEGDGDEGDDD
ncbi:MAG TPA: FecR domain-containing protein [Pseudorhizobium sp.]|nr:FecR domain-containing protein [Pseudorhizobium sp.]